MYYQVEREDSKAPKKIKKALPLLKSNSSKKSAFSTIPDPGMMGKDLHSVSGKSGGGVDGAEWYHNHGGIVKICTSSTVDLYCTGCNNS